MDTTNRSEINELYKFGVNSITNTMLTVVISYFILLLLSFIFKVSIVIVLKSLAVGALIFLFCISFIALLGAL